jgi:uncharacterized protein DUF6113
VPQPGLVVRATAHLAGLLLGGVVALAALMVHRSAFPWGLLLALVTSVALPWRLLCSRLPRTGTTYAVGWLVVFGVALLGRPEGDFVLAGDLEGYALIAGSLAVLTLGVAALPGRRRHH